MSKPPSQLQSVEQAWDFGQAPPRELETDSLLLYKSAQRSRWPLLVLPTLTVLSLAVLAVTLYLKSDPGGASAAQQMGVFPLLVRHNKPYAFKRVISSTASSSIERPSALCRQTTAGYFAA